MKLTKGNKVKITENSIFEIMGHKVVTGKVFMIYPDNHGFSFQCEQTGAMETCDFDDGKIELE